MPQENRVWGVLFTDAGLNDLKDALKPYLSQGSIGPYLYCKQVDMGNPYLRMIVDYPNPDGSPLETEMYVPHHYIKFIVAGHEKKQIGFAQFLALCSRSKWSKHFTNSPFLALLAMDGSKAAYKIISACSNAVS